MISRYESSQLKSLRGARPIPPLQVRWLHVRRSQQGLWKLTGASGHYSPLLMTKSSCVESSAGPGPQKKVMSRVESEP